MMNNPYFDAYYIALYFFVYGFLGWCTEVAYAAYKQHTFVNRGFLNGPICPIYGVGISMVVAFLTPIKSNIPLLYVASVILVTTLEGVTGFAMDKIFHNRWWDYSDKPLNINGYVCLPFSLIWGVACVIIVLLVHPAIHEVLSLIPHLIGLILIGVLGVCTFADLYVTVSSILKFNKNLESMDKIASELHEISDRVGEDIYQKSMEVIEKEEESKKEQECPEEISQDDHQHIKDLHQKYKELGSSSTAVSRRLVRAFPNMKSHHFNRHLNHVKANLNVAPTAEEDEK